MPRPKTIQSLYQNSTMGNLSMSMGPLVRLFTAIGAISSLAMLALLNLHH
jgi:hypothetical protein